MTEHQSKRMQAEDFSRVDYLLSVLSDLSKQDPSPVLREQMRALAADRLKENISNSSQSRATDRRRLIQLKPVFTAALLTAVGFAIILVVYFRKQKSAPADGIARLNQPVISAGSKPYVARTPQSSIIRQTKVLRSRSTVVESTSTRRMTIRLPYSNSAIETGTGTTIRVSMLQSELLSLGFPINATVQDRRIVAELTLGDDGLPRAISLPLPLR
jgi:hypothetical protein